MYVCKLLTLVMLWSEVLLLCTVLLGGGFCSKYKHTHHELVQLNSFCTERVS